jgi:hypothetical protein
MRKATHMAESHRFSSCRQPMNFVRNFLWIVGAALGSSLLGGIFGSVVALVSPDFVRGLTATAAAASIVRYAAGLGMIWGLFLGAAVMAFSLFISALVRLARALEEGRVRRESPE